MLPACSRAALWGLLSPSRGHPARGDLRPATFPASSWILQADQARGRIGNVRGAKFHIFPGGGPIIPSTSELARRWIQVQAHPSVILPSLQASSEISEIRLLSLTIPGDSHNKWYESFVAQNIGIGGVRRKRRARPYRGAVWFDLIDPDHQDRRSGCERAPSGDWTARPTEPNRLYLY